MWPFKKKDRKEEECFDCADKDWYKEQWEQALEWNNKNLDTLKSLLDSSDKLIKQVEDLDNHLKEVKKILKGYAVWDPMIVAHINRKNPHLNMKEGPATIYLKQIGEFDGDYGH
jgi:hypothetical protein